MGVVTDYFVNLISRQVDTAGIVVWYDPDAHYQEVAQNLAIQDTIVALYQGSFFALRHEIEPLLEKLEPPRLVVYVPLNQAETDHALIEIEVAGVVMRPGQQPATRNTRLSLIARNALKTILPEDRLGKIEKQVEAGSLSLSELDALAEKGEGITKGVLSLIFRAENPQDIALSFLTDEFHDKNLCRKAHCPNWLRCFSSPLKSICQLAKPPTAIVRDWLAISSQLILLPGCWVNHLPRWQQ